jgi:hypothetical protein
MGISIKLMGVPGPKLMDEEKFTLDMFGVSTQDDGKRLSTGR